MYPYQRLLEEGYEVDIAAPTKKKLQFVVHDFVEGFDTYTEKPGYTWPADLAFADVDPEDYVALVIPGGRAPEYIRNDPDCQRIIRHFFSGDRPVAHICAAPLARRGPSGAGGPDPPECGKPSGAACIPRRGGGTPPRLRGRGAPPPAAGWGYQAGLGPSRPRGRRRGADRAPGPRGRAQRR